MNSSNSNDMALWQSGFRPFFLGAGCWAVISMFIWFGLLQLNWQFGLNNLSPVIWHAHEMVFGYAVAVVAGFLLTAVPTWTNCRAFSGFRLIGVFSFWLLARITGLMGEGSMLPVTACLDILFILGLFVLISWPIIKSRQYRQFGILTKVLLLGASNISFYLGTGGVFENGIHYGLYTGFYLIIALILTIGGRVIPFFIQRGLNLEKPLQNRIWVNIASLVLFLLFWIPEVFFSVPQLTALVALLLLIVHSIRLFDWYETRIWKKPLLWVLYISYSFIVLGFGLKAGLLVKLSVSSQLVLHMFAIGGVGLMTCGMMSRVSLGHSGRNIHKISIPIVLAFIAIASAAVVRVFFPLFDSQHYPLWISVSQGLWITGFCSFLLVFFPILTTSRIDGRSG